MEKLNRKRKPRGLQWVGVKQTTKRTLNKTDRYREILNFQPYSQTPRGISPLQFYEEEGRDKGSTVSRHIVEGSVLLAMVALTLLPLKLEK